MKAIMSLWSVPIFSGKTNPWFSSKDMWNSWILSSHLAKQHYNELELITDDYGKSILIDKLNLPFTNVSTELQKYNDFKYVIWSFGKTIAYSLQTSPFIHLDFDVYLWQPLPERLHSANIVAQNPEWVLPKDENFPYKVPQFFENVKWVTPTMRIFDHLDLFQVPCCGIFGGTNLDIIQDYCRQAKLIVTHSDNAAAMKMEWFSTGFSCMCEQYLIGAVLESYSLKPEYLFTVDQDIQQVYRPNFSPYAKFTHLVGSKNKTESSEVLNNYVKEKYPKFHEKLSQLPTISL